MRSAMTFTCDTCGRQHDLSDISFGAHEPDQWRTLTEEERANSELGPEQCVINTARERSYYIRAVLPIPVRGEGDRTFEWGVWCSLSAASFQEISDHWDDPERVKLGPHFGWLCTQLPEYPDTMFLKTFVHQRPPGLRPTVELEPTDHPLAVHQREGIDRIELQSLVQKLLHQGEPTA